LHLLGMMMRLARRRRWRLLLGIAHEAGVRGALVLRLMRWTAAVAVVVKLRQGRRWLLLRMMGQRVLQAIQRKVQHVVGVLAVVNPIVAAVLCIALASLAIPSIETI